MPCEFPDLPRFVAARSLIAEAAALASTFRADLARLPVEQKSHGQDLVSAADRAVEDLIREGLAATFPDDGFLGEENGLKGGSSGFTWVVDPIDGTSCFLHGLTDWCVSIALVKHGETELGLILHPANGDLFVAARGRGAFLNGKPMRVDKEGAVENRLVGIGANLRIPSTAISGFIDRLLASGGMFYRNGSGALMLAHVACGRLIAYYEPAMNSWDCLAGLCLIREAGGWTEAFDASQAGLQACGMAMGGAPQVRSELLGFVSGEAKGSFS